LPFFIPYSLMAAFSPPLPPLARSQIRDKLRGCGYGMFIGDALAMPVHWYYNRPQIFRDFGTEGITKYEAPMPTFPGSIMNLSSTGGGGRGSDKGDIIGGVIMHEKKKFWTRGGNYHYHHGMKAGENTLDALVSLILTTVCSPGGDKGDGTRNHPLVVDDELFLDKYIKFFTTPGTHNDCYAATAHRMFFLNYSQGKGKFECAANDGHNTDAIDGLINVIPLAICKVLGLLSSQKEEKKEEEGASLESLELWKTPFAATSEVEQKEIYRVINLVRRSDTLPAYGYHFYGLLVRVLLGQDVNEAVLQTCDTISPQMSKMVRNSVNSSDDPLCACYIETSFPVLLLFAYKYGKEGFEKTLLRSTNAGGENTNRGTCLGGLMGGADGFSSLSSSSPDLVNGLVRKEQIEREFNELCQRYSEKGGGK